MKYEDKDKLKWIFWMIVTLIVTIEIHYTSPLGILFGIMMGKYFQKKGYFNNK